MLTESQRIESLEELDEDDSEGEDEDDDDVDDDADDDNDDEDDQYANYTGNESDYLNTITNQVKGLIKINHQIVFENNKSPFFYRV